MPEKLIAELSEDKQRELWELSGWDYTYWEPSEVESQLHDYIREKYPMVHIRKSQICWDNDCQLVDTTLEFVSLPSEPDVAAILQLVEDMGILYEYRHALGVVFYSDVGIAVDRHGRVGYRFEGEEYVDTDDVMNAVEDMTERDPELWWDSFDPDMPLSLDQLYGEHYRTAVRHAVDAATAYLENIVEEMSKYVKDDYEHATSFETFVDMAAANEWTVEVDDEDA